MNTQKLIIRTYNYDLKNKKEITLQELINKNGLNENDLQNKIKQEIENEQKIALSCVITRELAENWINADIIVKSNNELALYENCLGSVIRTALKEGVVV